MNADRREHQIGATESPWHAVNRLVEAEGAGANGYLARLATSGAPRRDQADLIHALCAVHGSHPDMIEDALGSTSVLTERQWLTAAAAAFAHERLYLSRLTTAAGPVPRTPGKLESEAAFAGLRQAFGLLARSGRSGCALGAVAALVADWHGLRPLLDNAAHRFEIAALPSDLPEDEPPLVITPAAQRAMMFGAQQLLVQHRGLWDLLESRAAARDSGRP
jgi:hypothetical protein